MVSSNCNSLGSKSDIEVSNSSKAIPTDGNKITLSNILFRKRKRENIDSYTDEYTTKKIKNNNIGKAPKKQATGSDLKEEAYQNLSVALLNGQNSPNTTFLQRLGYDTKFKGTDEEVGDSKNVINNIYNETLGNKSFANTLKKLNKLNQKG